MDMSTPQENLVGRALREAPNAEARWIINQAELNGFDHQPVTERFIGRIETALDILIEVHLKGQKVVDEVRFDLDNAKTLGDIRAVMGKVQHALPPEGRTV